MSKKVRTFLVWVVLLMLFFVAFQIHNSGDREQALSFLGYPSFQRDIEARRIAFVEVNPQGTLEVTLRDGSRYVTAGVLDAEVSENLARQGVRPQLAGNRSRGSSGTVVLALIVGGLVLLFLLWKWAAKGQFKSYATMTKTKARTLPASRACTFADVGGLKEAKEALRDLTDFLQDPVPWRAAGARVPRGILLEGPPGCGKTLLARALAGEAKAKFFFVSASEFVELFVGVGAARVRDTFETAAREAPAVVFIDELDAVARHRGSGIGGSHDEREQTLNQLLVCLDGIETYDRVVVLAATNRSDILDGALLRPGRFDRRIHIKRPEREERLEILRVHLRGRPLAKEVSEEWVADLTEGLNGADIESLINEASIRSVRRARTQGGGASELQRVDFQEASAASRARGGEFDSLDAVLIGSSSQVSRPPGRALAQIFLLDGSSLRGEVLWANGEFVKLRKEGSPGEMALPKAQIKSIEALDGTAAALPEDVRADPWAAHPPGLA